MQFGKPIAEFQAVQHMLADMATELEAARLLVWRAAWMQDQKVKTTRESSVAKYYAARAAVRACNAAVQIHGGYGYTREFPVERYLRDVKLARDRRGDQRGAEDGDRARAAQGLRVTALPPIAERVQAGDVRAAARLMREIDDDSPQAEAALRALYPASGRAFVLGITGPPGAGKSTLVDALIEHWRKAGERVGVVAIDPTSPVTGGAILGDRIRMQRHALDEGVFIRSLATRGQLGGLSRAAADVVTVLDVFGSNIVLVETVGVGQDEVDVAMLADLVVVVLVPGLGDEVQALKAGLIEVADLFVINKADREGADRAARDLQTTLALREGSTDQREILKVVALSGQGIPALASAITSLRERGQAEGTLASRRRRQAEVRLRAILLDRLRRRTEATLSQLGGLGALAEEVASRRLDPYTAVNRLLPRQP